MFWVRVDTNTEMQVEMTKECELVGEDMVEEETAIAMLQALMYEKQLNHQNRRMK